jgi:hypothetical protein
VTSFGRAASAARLGKFANVWQIQAIFAKHWQNGCKPQEMLDYENG